MASKKAPQKARKDDEDARSRILGAAMATFMEHGFGAATTLEIATRAKVSKRELYALVGNKEQMLAACVAGRGRRMRLPDDFPAPTDAASFRFALVRYGVTLLRELYDPAVLEVFRLGISEAKRSPGVAHSIEEFGRKPAKASLESLLRSALAARLLADEELATMMSRYQGMLLGDRVWILLGTSAPPNSTEMKHRAEDVADLFLKLYGR